jgi:hypothetical protein
MPGMEIKNWQAIIMIDYSQSGSFLELIALN